MKHYRGWFLIVLLFFILAEIIWSWGSGKKAYKVKDTFTNLAIFAGFHFSKFLFAGYQLGVTGFASRYAVLNIPASWWSFAICFVLADFIYYWFHRASHVWKPLWAFHLVHHSGMCMNLTTAYRLNWFSALISPLFFMPLAVIGFPPAFIAASYALNLLYQFFMHTEAVGKLGFAEGWIDTPSAHRVHHGSNRIYIDKNFGGVFMIWDRLFKTWQPETEKPVYGITSGLISYNPFTLMFRGFIDLFRNKMHYKG
ncbi:sterol desaturase family protein [Foetidibacter luteolus]|uniref:sterol desaturase family protein n=1 Tax=Foetidibacter luteolus TaxID=2608880 RepID=UPI001A98C0A5|nr:sterol desaturase family protein [Foetidibacter luteolus]